MTQQRKSPSSKPIYRKLVKLLSLSILGVLPAIIAGIVELLLPIQLDEPQPNITIGDLNINPGNDPQFYIGGDLNINPGNDPQIHAGGNVNINSNNQTTVDQSEIHTDFSKNINTGDLTFAINDNDVSSNEDMRINFSDDDVYSNINQIPQTHLSSSFDINANSHTVTEPETIIFPKLKKKDLE